MWIRNKEAGTKLHQGCARLLSIWLMFWVSTCTSLLSGAYNACLPYAFVVPSQKCISVLEAQTAMLQRLLSHHYDFSHSFVFVRSGSFQFTILFQRLNRPLPHIYLFDVGYIFWCLLIVWFRRTSNQATRKWSCTKKFSPTNLPCTRTNRCCNNCLWCYSHGNLSC